MFLTKIGPQELHNWVLKEVYALAFTILIKYPIVLGQDFFMIFAHKSLSFWDESIVTSDAVRAKNHQHCKWRFRLVGKLIGHAYRTAEKLSLSSEWLFSNLSQPLRWQNFFLQIAAKEAKFRFPQSVFLQLYLTLRLNQIFTAF